jgi:hypothetical protein
MAFDIVIGSASQPDTGFDIVIGDEEVASEGSLLEFTIPVVAAGTVMLILVVRNEAAIISDATWTQVITAEGASNGIFLDGYKRVADGTAGSRAGDIVSFLSLAEQEMHGSLLQLENANADSLIELIDSDPFTSSTAPAAPIVDSTQAENSLVCLWTVHTSVTLTAPADFTQLETYSSAVTSTKTTMVATRTADATGSVDPGSALCAPAATGRAYTIVITYEAPPLVTIETIRDRIITLITAITPSVASGTRFRHSQDEGDGDFQELCEAQPAGAFRRFQVRNDGTTELPLYSDVLYTLEPARFVVTVAYPHDKRAGRQGARDRDDAIDSDWRKINYAIGIYGRANFSVGNDCTPTGAVKSIERGESCDFLVVTMDCTYYLKVDE